MGRAFCLEEWTRQVLAPIHTCGSGLVGVGDEPWDTGESRAELEPRAAGSLTERMCHSFKERREGLFLPQEKKGQGAAG